LPDVVEQRIEDAIDRVFRQPERSTVVKLRRDTKDGDPGTARRLGADAFAKPVSSPLDLPPSALAGGPVDRHAGRGR
jgi:hypothetical protein